ncbi:MAG: GNAT family N-acetyltransferase [Bacilli bacterium]|nr:GNAT family N-acetyltransferase [Bacilli bacterium]
MKLNLEEKLINLLKNVCAEKLIQNLSLTNINGNEELILKGVMFDDEHTCYNNYEKLEDVITGLIVSADNYGIYLENEFIGIISIFNQYYKDLTRLEVSMSIKNQYRNMNIGKYCLETIISKYFKDSNNKSIHLSIREDNIKSRKMAEHCGFKLYPGYKSCKNFIDLKGNQISQVQYLLKRKDYIK